MASERRMQRVHEECDPSRAAKRRRFQRRNSKTAAMLRSDSMVEYAENQVSWEKMSSQDTEKAIQLYAMVEKQHLEKN
jgi:hypothetical protein